MRISELNGKNVCILGYGREGKAMTQALETYAPTCAITIADKNETSTVDNPRYGLQTGTSWLQDLSTFDIIIKSPGIPLMPELKAHSSKLTSSTQIFLDTIADTGATVAGVTGSKGKSTTVSLLYAILKEAGKDVHLVGNIGEPAIAHLADAKMNTIFVLEMSSYQLMDLRVSPHVAVITSFFPEHLDYHGSLEAYRAAKENICRHQTERDIVVFDATSQGAQTIAETSPGQHIAGHAEDLPVATGQMRLQGEHNRRNAALAYLTASLWQVPDLVSIPVILSFQGLPHRLQSLGVIGGIEWVDDAISTTPDSTIMALDTLGDRVTTVILGGQDRGVDFTALAQRLADSTVRRVILFPGSGPRIRAAIGSLTTTIELHDAANMQQAIEIAKQANNAPRDIAMQKAMTWFDKLTMTLFRALPTSPEGAPSGQTSKPANPPLFFFRPPPPATAYFAILRKRARRLRGVYAGSSLRRAPYIEISIILCYNSKLTCLYVTFEPRLSTMPSSRQCSPEHGS